MKSKLVYLDSAANTPLDKRVYKEMKKYMKFPKKGNSFAIHPEGIENFKAVEAAREKISKILRVPSEEVYFTSGATESNNWVIRSLALHELTKPVASRKTKILVSAAEHASVMNPCLSLEELGFEVKIIPLKKDGSVKVSELKSMVDTNTLLVCVMSISNETGAKNDVNMLAKYCHKFKALFLSDFTQRISIAPLSFGFEAPNVDYITFSGHKVYGPTGVGCLVRRKTSPLYPYLYGGNQESGLRGGTHNVAGIVGLAKAIEIEHEEPKGLYYPLLYSYFKKSMLTFNEKHGTDLHLNGSPYFFNILSLNCDSLGIDDIAQVLSLRGIECSTGSACHNNSDTPVYSKALLSMGLSVDEIKRTVRVSFNKYTSINDIRMLFTTLEQLLEEK